MQRESFLYFACWELASLWLFVMMCVTLVWTKTLSGWWGISSSHSSTSRQQEGVSLLRRVLFVRGGAGALRLQECGRDAHPAEAGAAHGLGDDPGETRRLFVFFLARGVGLEDGESTANGCFESREIFEGGNQLNLLILDLSF